MLSCIEYTCNCHPFNRLIRIRQAWVIQHLPKWRDNLLTSKEWNLCWWNIKCNSLKSNANFDLSTYNMCMGSEYFLYATYQWIGLLNIYNICEWPGFKSWMRLFEFCFVQIMNPFLLWKVKNPFGFHPTIKK